MIRRRLLVLTLAALVPTVAVIAYNEWNLHRSRALEVRELAERSAQVAFFEIERIIAGVESTLTAAATAPIVGRGLPGCSEYITALNARLGYLSGIAVADAAGRIVCPPGNFGVADRAYFHDALRTTELVVGEYTISRSTGRPVLPLALRLDGTASGEPRVIVAGLDLAWLGARLRERGLPEGGSLTVADRNGVILAREPLPGQFVGTLIPAAFRHLVTAERPGSLEVMSQDGTPRVLGYVPATTHRLGIYVSAGLSSEVSYAAVQRATRASMLIAAAGALAALLLTWFTGQRIFVRPIKHLIAVARAWQRGDHAARSRLRPPGEFGQLSAALDGMMDEIARGHQERGLLVEELKHRGKNTLAIVQAIASATFDTERPGKEALADFIARIGALSRAHDMVLQKSAPGDLERILSEVTQPHCGAGAGRCLFQGPPARLNSRQAQALSLIVHELGTNSVKYGALSRPSGEVIVTWVMDDAGPNSGWRIRWEERGGPPVHPPARRGFGSRLIRAFGAELGTASIDFAPAGVVCEIHIRKCDSEPADTDAGKAEAPASAA